MTQPRLSGGPIPSLHSVRGRPLPMQIPVDRRNASARAALVRRIRNEFWEMPGLVLSIRQASRLFDVGPGACERIFTALERDGFLRRRADGSYGCA